MTRNVAATMNGLVDGWLHWGFHSGYSEDISIQCSFGELSARWWNFDRPPGWKGLCKADLLEVTLFQWLESHRAILSIQKKRKNSGLYYRLKYEDLIDSKVRLELFIKLFSWLDLTMSESMTSVVTKGLSWQMATRAPEQRRWMKRADLILPLVEQKSVQSMMSTLGYSVDSSDWY